MTGRLRLQSRSRSFNRKSLGEVSFAYGGRRDASLTSRPMGEITRDGGQTVLVGNGYKDAIYDVLKLLGL